MYKLATPLDEIRGIGPKFIEKLGRLHIRTIKDLLYHLPFRYQDFSQITPIDKLVAGETVTVHGRVTALSMSRTPRRRMYIIRASVEDETGKVKVVWFNQKFIITQLKKGMNVNLSGKVAEEKNGKVYLSSPVFEVISREGQETRHTGRIVPIYPETRGITSRGIRFALSKVVDYIKDAPEFLPEEVLKKHTLPHLHKAFSDVHFPKSLEDAHLALKRFSFQDLFLLQLLNANEQYRLHQHTSFAVPKNSKLIESYCADLPFELTGAQKKALDEILDDLSCHHPTSRLLQGDVGSGKTIVAALAALVTADAGYQSAFMAPTEVLAVQHYQTFKEYAKDFSGGVGLLTGSESKAFFGDGLETEYKKKDLVDAIKKGTVAIVVGTHAMIQKAVDFKMLGFVVIDEQHRFGVNQRAQLADHKQDASRLPHFLSMSATPIPRTLALTAFGDLELSLINELPKDRKKIITKVVPSTQRVASYAFVEKEVGQGRQAFVICPRIEPPEDSVIVTRKMLFQLDAVSVKEEYEKLKKTVFPNLRVEMLHGKMKAAEKREVMEKFKKGKTDILVATSVIEVGVDVPNATIMMIEGSERFGLAQLYQFRGRVGRGAHQSYCFLFSSSKASVTRQRLQALVNAHNGFELAEMDLKFRGPGQFLGREQTGMPDLAMKALANPEYVKTARDTARELMKNDPDLKEYPYLSAYLNLFQEQVHME